MPRDLRIARPFQIVGSDERVYAIGIGYYNAMSDEFADHWYTQWHTQSQVLARGGRLCQQRWLGNVAVVGRSPPMIWLDRDPAYANDIMPSWPPIFADSILLERFFRLEPGDDGFIVSRTDPVTGEPFYRERTAHDRLLLWQNGRPLPKLPERTIRVYPGDGVSPPVAVATDNGNCGREQREASEFERRQAERHRVVTAMAIANIEPAYHETPAPHVKHGGEQITPPIPPQDRSVFAWRDPRAA